jgi:hypothetical protein
LEVSLVELFDIENFQAHTDDLRQFVHEYVTRADSETIRRLYGIIRIISS